MEPGIDEKSSPELAAYKTARAYLAKGGSSALSRLENSPFKTEIRIGGVSPEGYQQASVYEYCTNRVFVDSDGDGKINAQYDQVSSLERLGKRNGTIYWSMLWGTIDAQGNYHSPAMVLDHEANHALFAAYNLVGSYNGKLTSSGVNPGMSILELATINASNYISKTLNNGDGGRGQRKDHFHSGFFRTFGVLDFIGIFYNFQVPELPQPAVSTGSGAKSEQEKSKNVTPPLKPF
ncbi:MAG: hypothetical protein EOO09_15310 [Chitinophagaceae bacterium]|nr:MAG: hypothetical protein EOO09_15310 [Chitinophagaceae bacterium]